MNADGSNVRQLTNFPAQHRSPAFAPDGYQIAFWSNREEGGVSGWHIWLTDIDGRAPRRLTQDGTINTDPSWSPDGQRIVFVSNRDGPGPWIVYTMNPDGSEQTSLGVEARVGQPRPNYSPDGQKIAFSSTRDDPWGDIFVMNADGSEVENLTPGPVAGGYPVWSPDGRTLAFDGSLDPRSGEPWRVYLMDLDTRELTPLTKFRAEPHAWAWFPLPGGPDDSRPCPCAKE